MENFSPKVFTIFEGFRDTGFEPRDSGSLSKMEERLGIESIHTMWDVKNNHRDYGIARKFGSG